MSYDVDDLDSTDEGEMTVVSKGQLTDWVWTFAGPGHPKAVAQSDRLARERLHEDRQKEQARVNGKKWRAPEETVDQTRARNINFIVERVIGWTPVQRGGKDYPFSEANARAILADPRKGGLLLQCLEYLGDEASFTDRSPSASPPSPSESSN